ncbi:hypothetical protein [Flavobacterium selenitireducens]|uniref:hypothetical protein n=1 Tax=Flavobacterium selenitireducens TaxID=2722704 RepID=UPI00168A5EF8|nr:hypothetical protein [Flavobacterium selenitireducens]MBD3583925.1 hypothetical protein [Flavobacterium selenitireducens]
MKLLSAIALTYILNAGCSPANYSYENPSNATGIDFTKGTFLINKIDVPFDVRDRIEDLVNADFKNKLGNRAIYYPLSSKILLSQNLNARLDPKDLQDIKTGTGYDFFVRLRGGINKSDLSTASFSSSNNLIKSYPENSSYFEIEIYDLETKKPIYYQKVTAVTSRELSKENKGLSFSKSADQLIVAAYQKLFQKLERNSIF